MRGVDVVVELAFVDQRLALLGRQVDVFEHQVDEAAEDVGVLLREAEHLRDDAQRDVLRVVDRGVDLRAGRRCASSSSRHSSRVNGS